MVSHVLVFAYSFAICVFFFNDTATTEIYTLSLHDALPICSRSRRRCRISAGGTGVRAAGPVPRSEEHTSELQSRVDLVCRLLLEKKKKKKTQRGIAPLPTRNSTRTPPRLAPTQPLATKQSP